MRIDEEREKRNDRLHGALDNAKTCGVLHICAKCQKVRDDKGYWKKMEGYYESHSDALFSHGLCPECMDILYGNDDWYVKRRWRK